MEVVLISECPSIRGSMIHCSMQLFGSHLKTANWMTHTIATAYHYMYSMYFNIVIH